MKVLIIFIPSILLISCQITAAGYVFEAMVHSYSNPHSQARFLPCDLLCFFGSACQCDNQFTFCLRNENGSRSTNVDFCSLGDAQQTQFFDNSDNMNFEMLDTLGNSVPNPLVFTGDIWPGGFLLFVQIVDIDVINFILQITVHEVVDNIFIEIPLDPSLSFTDPEMFHGNHGKGSLELSFRVTLCDVENCLAETTPPPTSPPPTPEFDVDECETNNGGCAQFCTNTFGSFICSCNPGFIIDGDGRSCNAIAVTTTTTTTHSSSGNEIITAAATPDGNPGSSDANNKLFSTVITGSVIGLMVVIVVGIVIIIVTITCLKKMKSQARNVEQTVSKPRSIPVVQFSREPMKLSNLGESNNAQATLDLPPSYDVVITKCQS